MKANRIMEPQDKGTGQSVSEQISDATQGTDEPMEVAHPGLTPMLVMGMYPLILVFLIVVAVGYMMLSQKKPVNSPTMPVAADQIEFNVPK